MAANYNVIPIIKNKINSNVIRLLSRPLPHIQASKPREEAGIASRTGERVHFLAG